MSPATYRIVVHRSDSEDVPSYPRATSFRGMETVMEDQRPLQDTQPGGQPDPGKGTQLSTTRCIS